jgi:hypothetical protein
MTVEDLKIGLREEYTQNFLGMFSTEKIAPRGFLLDDAHDIESFATSVVKEISKLEPNPSEGRRGGVLAIARAGENPFFYATKIGEIVPEKVDKYFRFATAKAAVLVQNPNFNTSRENSTLSSDIKLTVDGQEVPAGAIRCDGGLILSYSGFSPEDDENVVLATAVVSGSMNDRTALMIAQITGNIRYERIHEQIVSS